MKLKKLIFAAISLILTCAVVLFSIGYYGNYQMQANKGLYEACSTGNAAAAAYWLAKGADVNAPDPGYRGIPGQTALMMCAHLNADTVEMLLLLGADPNAIDRNGRSAIFFATDGYNAEVLVRFGADVTMKDKDGLTALEWRQKNNYLMDDELKIVLEGKGPAAKVREKSRAMVEEAGKERTGAAEEAR
jgi:hypothetical protein